MWIDDICQRVNALSAWRQIAFMAICCERMLPNFYEFNRQTGFGSGQVLRLALSNVWEWLENDEISGLNLIMREVERQAPDTEKYSNPFTSSALDAANGIATVLEAIVIFSETHVWDVVEFARDTVDMWVQEKEDMDANAPMLEEKILSHPLMLREIDAMMRSIASLDVAGSRKELVRDLRGIYEARCTGSILP